MSEFKIFVGNVPFECNTIEFKKCFENMYGYVNAEIVTKYNTVIQQNIHFDANRRSGTSRGFGFVTVNNQETANNLLNNTNINFKDRTLRFTEYIGNNRKDSVHIFVNKNQEKQIFDDVNIYMFDNNLKVISNKTISTEKLREIFKNYNTQICFMFVDRDSGTETNIGIIKFCDNSDYINLLNSEKIIYDDIELTFEKA